MIRECNFVEFIVS